MEFRQYRRTQIAQMRPFDPVVDEVIHHSDYFREIPGVSISDADMKNGSPKLGDMIARNPMNPSDQWLVAEAYFKANFEPCPE